jgi:hypothetical protein
VHLTRALASLHLLDFNPYLPRTDPLLFTYDDLHALLLRRIHSTTPDFLPEFRVIPSRAHPAAARNAPANQHNMVPLDALTIASGRDIEQFAEAWREEVRKGAGGGGESSDEEEDG